MRAGRSIFLTWSLVVYFISAYFFSDIMNNFIKEITPWQKRLIDTNIEYAIALFFLIFNILWQGIAVDCFSKTPFRILSIVYRAFIFPIIIAGALMAQLPFHLNLANQMPFGSLVLASVWIVIVGDPIGWVGQYLSSSSWFQKNIFKTREESANIIFYGFRGRVGMVVLHVGVLLLFCIGHIRVT